MRSHRGLLQPLPPPQDFRARDRSDERVHVRFEPLSCNSEDGTEGQVLEGTAGGELPQLVFQAGGLPVLVGEEDGLGGAFLA